MGLIKQQKQLGRPTAEPRNSFAPKMWRGWWRPPLADAFSIPRPGWFHRYIDDIHTHIYIYIWTITLWLFNIAMENGPFIDGLPIKHGDFPWLCLLNNQMVTIIYQGMHIHDVAICPSPRSEAWDVCLSMTSWRLRSWGLPWIRKTSRVKRSFRVPADGRSVAGTGCGEDWLRKSLGGFLHWNLKDLIGIGWSVAEVSQVFRNWF